MWTDRHKIPKHVWTDRHKIPGHMWTDRHKNPEQKRIQNWSEEEERKKKERKKKSRNIKSPTFIGLGDLKMRYI